ncbi:unnamed protein product (macronuclear) [Paramecium tetraurelia]|uniref:Nuclear pore protein n=1 Tax=Paramecium tetraurelia TaxID=5888 RepID=A0DNZ0_PARTE|nr:uncharacterized protein GSPATT00018953001 [Paramecium tetraurelia]CAK84757.1 unnamed protein product [Paramecium tetraurelia]|eukprot:XP_001452154.1 hypothetical protein (macronuclear) [Paramecium tetraurelia strain d4-2]
MNLGSQPSMFLTPQPNTQQASSIFGQPQTLPTMQTQQGLQPQPQPLQPLATQPLQPQLTTTAIVQPPNQAQKKGEFENLVKFYKEKPELTKQQELQLFVLQTKYLKNRIQKKFQKQINVKQTQYLLVDTLSQKVCQLFQKFNLNERNLEYTKKDELQRLSQRIKADQEKQNLLFQSQIKVKELYSQPISNYLELNSKFQMNKNIINTMQKKEVLTQSRQTKELINLLHENRAEQVQPKSVSIKSISFNTHNQLIIEKLFKEQEFYEKLEQFLEFSKQIKDKKNIDKTDYYESLFSCFVNIQSDHKDIMKLLSQQFQGIQFQSKNIQKDLLKNSIKILEAEMCRRIGVLDIANINCNPNQISYYQRNLRISTMRSYQNVQTFKAGILFLLMRCGQLKQAKSIIFQFAKHQKYQLFFELLEDRIETNQQKIQKLDQFCDDDLFEQCYLIAFDSGSVSQVFENQHFPQDQDLFFWMTLKTTHITNQIGSDNWTLSDLQEAIPREIGFKMDIHLQRYEEILKNIYKTSASLVSKLEYFTLFFIMQSLLEIQNESTITEMNLILNGILGQVFEKYPDIGGLLIILTEPDLQQAINKIQTEMMKYKYGVELFQDKKFFENFENMFGENQKTQDFIESIVQEQFQQNLLEYYKDFTENIIKGNNINELLATHKAFIGNIDMRMEELKSYLEFRKTSFTHLAMNLYQISGILLLTIECQFNLKAQELKIISSATSKFLVKNNNNPKQYYNLFSTLYQIALSNPRQKHIFDLLQAFNFLIQSSKIEQFNENKFKQYLVQIDISKLTQILIANKQLYLLKLFFWMIEITLEIHDKKINEYKNMKETFQRMINNKTYQNVVLNSLFLINREVDLHFQDFKLMPK